MSVEHSHERVRTAQLRAEVSEARADRDKALAELEAANLRITDLEAAAKAERAESDDFRGLIRMAVKNRIWFEIGSDNVWVGTDHYPHGEDVDTAIAILERELRERAIRYGAAAGAAKKGA